MENKAPPTFPLERIDLGKLKLYPKEYQFRLGQAESGEVESHKINDTAWSPLLHGAPIYVHKRRDQNGEWEYAVVDGHHRVNFAQRLAAEGKGPAQLDAFVLEEEKGINTETAKLMLAFKDIARGDGSPVEAAMVMREAKEAPGVREKFLPSLQMDKGNLKLAVKFSGLKALDKIASGEIPLELATHVVEKVKDPSRHDAVLEIACQKLKQDYANYAPNIQLASLLTPKANDNQKSWVAAIASERASANRQFSLGV